MSIVPIITFIEIYDPKNVPPSGDIAGAIEHRFQNIGKGQFLNLYEP